MRRLVKWLLFGSSYTPLFIILLLRDIEVNRLYFPKGWGDVIILFSEFFKTPWFSYTLLVLVFLSNLTLILLLKDSRRVQPKIHVVRKAATRNSEALNYIVTYIIPFLSFDSSNTIDILSLLILLFVMAIIYVNSHLLYTNPMLSIIGYKIFKVQTDAQCSMVLISKKERMKPMKIKGVHLTDDIYLEV